MKERKHNLFILKQHLPKNYYNNIIKAKELYDSYSDKKELKNIEEELFEKYNDFCFKDVGIVESIIIDKLYNDKL